MPSPRVSPSPQSPVQAGIVRCDAAALEDLGRRLLQAAGVPEAHAQLVAQSLVAANLRGVDSHGMQMITSYLLQLGAGGVAAAREGRVMSESGACLAYDGENGLGQVIADRCTDHVIRLARAHGIGIVVARNANHFGAAAYWGEKIVREGCIGIVMCNACPAVPPWQGLEPRFGTNPFCAGVPAAGPFGWMLDMATTTVALGKLGDAAFRGQATIPEWWGFLGPDGQPTASTSAAQAGRPTAFGRYKGSGLAMMVEILTAGLSGGPMASQIPAFGAGDHPLEISHTFLAIDPSRFMAPAVFPERMEQLTGLVKSSAPAPGYEEVLVAGEPEWRTAQERAQRGIPLPRALWEQIGAAATGLKVAMPPGASSSD